MLDPQPGSHRADEPAVEPEVLAPWGDGIGDFLRWRGRGLVSWSAWRLWLLGVVGVVSVTNGALGHDPAGISNGFSALAILLAIFFVPPLVSDGFKRFKGRIGL